MTDRNNIHSLTIAAMAAALVAVTAAVVAPHVATASTEGDDTATITETAILAGGCFWGMEDLLRELDGVIDTEVGYAADAERAKRTGAEAVRIVFDPERLSYENLLRFYFRIHDPTTRNRQGNDVGAQYRSAIFVLSNEQRIAAQKIRSEVDASGFWKRSVVTEIVTAGDFKVARDFHQDYLEKNPGGYTCHYYRADRK